MARVGKEERESRLNDQKRMIMHVPTWKHHAVCDCIKLYIRVPDVLAEIFAGTLRFFPNRKNSQNIVPANNSNNKVVCLWLWKWERGACIDKIHTFGVARVQFGGWVSDVHWQPRSCQMGWWVWQTYLLPYFHSRSVFFFQASSDTSHARRGPLKATYHGQDSHC